MELLKEIKTRLSITGDFNDDLIKAYAFDVMEYMKNAGVPVNIINSNRAYGTIAKGVSDLWLEKSFSNIFREMVIQLTIL